ncbi:MAG: sigma-70 family RNA polymerase sigma factor, partial [Clostridia bacterium]|nr:sigma-70 family RNA polymerase sigma factor [Clostridia bacterium]
MTEKELEQLYNEAYKAVYWTAISILKNKEDAEDVVQDTFITAYESYDTLQDKTKAVPWIKKIAANKCINIVTRRRTVNADDEILEDIEEVPDNFLPDSIAESAESRKIIMDIINNCLSEDTAMTIILFYFNEMSVKEIAERLGIPQGTVLSRLNYAKKVIKKEVEKYEKDNKDKLFAVIVPFLTLLFEKEAEQVPFAPMPASLKGITASSKAAAKGTAKTAAKASAGGTALKITAIGIASAAVIAAGGFIAYKALTSGVNSAKESSETEETYETNGTTKETDRPINVLGMTPDQLDLQGGYVRYCTSHNKNEDTTEEKSQFYYDADGNISGPYADRILGYHIAFGASGESVMWGRMNNHYGDYGISHTRHFLNWGLKKYGSAEALQNVWGADRFDGECLRLPSPDERYHRKENLTQFYRGDTLGTLSSDMDEFLSESCADAIEHFCRIVRCKAPEKL